MVRHEVTMSKDSRKDSDKDRHTPILEDGADTLQRVEIITGTGRRRRWSTDAKAAIVAESFAPGASASGGGAATRHQPEPVVSLASSGNAGEGRGARGSGVPPGFVPVAITGCGGQVAVVRGAGGD